MPRFTAGGRPMLPLGVLLVALVAGCTPDARKAPAVPAEDVEEGWVVNVAGPEADEGEPGAVLLTRRADAGGDEAYRPRLVIGCVEAETQVYVEWGTDLGAGVVPVETRLGDEPARTLRWRPSDDHEAAGLWHDSTSVPFLRTLPGHDRLTTRVIPEDGAPVASTFTLAGLDTLVARVQQACSWE